LNQAFPEVEVQLKESSGGVFEVSLDGDLLFSKRRLGRHAAPGEVLGLVKGKASGMK
jgi:selT/selW/selH-like putative selenoprotein